MTIMKFLLKAGGKEREKREKVGREKEKVKGNRTESVRGGEQYLVVLSNHSWQYLESKPS